MVKLKNGVKSSQLWKIISPPIVNKNLPNFGDNVYYTSKNLKKIFYLPNIMKTIFLKRKKPVGGVCSSQNGSQKIPLKKI